VLVVTGEDYEGHLWKETVLVLERQLSEDPRLAVCVSHELDSLRSPSLRDFDAVVMHFKNYDPELPGREGYDRLDEFVQEGGGLVLVHFACGAFQEFKQDFVGLAGRVWNPELRGHDPYGSFEVEVLDTGHPVTQGLSSFETTDELYTCLEGDTAITVLAEACSVVDGKRYPMAFVLQHGKGRVFHSPLGHDVDALSVPAVGELFRHGCAWAAGLDPTPEDPR
jgi:type 1 glutamine amidotransferase